ncbi:glycosyltransferase family 2 protein [Streptococcus macacae]|uniref:Glycosyltransferase, group 2 family protein n=1 Tax=Streptococcus macacae NCTC 11558 TaxID=764298 RepID=G5JUI8_9STRE|nr:glycosyltransferase [Streptococcus macacae]EHJ52882.1 glycosyltransferase, group 2 family protein [Streptococcus macacae NCTC 11558]SUN78630.1 glycosyl transferase family protein [Streptococcus macacae NCTC 11558]
MSKKISVIVPVYNVEKYLSRCLDSLVNQTYSNLEIIIVNDGTKDKSMVIAERFAQKDPRIKIIHQENAGLSEARNKGLQYITGDYVAFLDSDDWLEKDAYAYMLRLLEDYGADICVGAIRRTAQPLPFENSQKPKENLLTQKAYAKKYFKIGSQSIEYYVWNKLYKRQVVEGIRYPKGFYAEDVPTTFRYILKAQKIIVTDKIVYHYFSNEQGLTAQFSSKHFDVLKGWDIVLAEARKTGSPDYIAWAEINRQRADFALLTEISLSPQFNSLKVSFKKEIETLSQQLKQNKSALLRAPLPFNRKLLIRLYASHYFFFASLINRLTKIKSVVKK